MISYSGFRCSAVVLVTLGLGAVSAGGRGSVPVEGGGGAVAAEPLLLGAPAPWPASWSASCGGAAVSTEAGLATIRAGGSAPAKLYIFVDTLQYLVI